jgi:hypothetical protein
MLRSQSVVNPGVFDVMCSSVSPNSKTLVLGDTKGRILLVPTDYFSIKKDLNARRGPPVCCVAFDPTCRVLAFGGHGGRPERLTL